MVKKDLRKCFNSKEFNNAINEVIRRLSVKGISISENEKEEQRTYMERKLEELIDTTKISYSELRTLICIIGKSYFKWKDFEIDELSYPKDEWMNILDKIFEFVSDCSKNVHDAYTTGTIEGIEFYKKLIGVTESILRVLDEIAKFLKKEEVLSLIDSLKTIYTIIFKNECKAYSNGTSIKDRMFLYFSNLYKIAKLTSYTYHMSLHDEGRLNYYPPEYDVVNYLLFFTNKIKLISQDLPEWIYDLTQLHLITFFIALGFDTRTACDFVKKIYERRSWASTVAVKSICPLFEYYSLDVLTYMCLSMFVNSKYDLNNRLRVPEKIDLIGANRNFDDEELKTIRKFIVFVFNEAENQNNQFFDYIPPSYYKFKYIKFQFPHDDWSVINTFTYLSFVIYGIKRLYFDYNCYGALSVRFMENFKATCELAREYPDIYLLLSIPSIFVHLMPRYFIEFLNESKEMLNKVKNDESLLEEVFELFKKYKFESDRLCEEIMTRIKEQMGMLSRHPELIL